MNDFSYPNVINYFGLPGSPNNKMEPGKRPLSSMSPAIITDGNGDVKMVVGASGGTRITTTVAQVNLPKQLRESSVHLSKKFSSTTIVFLHILFKPISKRKNLKNFFSNKIFIYWNSSGYNEGTLVWREYQRSCRCTEIASPTVSYGC